MKRIIPRLDIKGPNLVKGINLEGLRVLGDPSIIAQHYAENGADELIFQDVVASLYNRNSLVKIVEKVAKNIFIPLTVGGGIRSLNDIEELLKVGADKICINTAAIKDYKFIYEASRVFGSSTIVIAIESIKSIDDGEYYAFTDNGREITGKKVLEWVKEVEDNGAGEIVLTSVDREGTGEGFESILIHEVLKISNIPIIIHGGASSKDDVLKLFQDEKRANAVALASILHYDCIENLSDKYNFISSEFEGNKSFLKAFQKPKKFKSVSIDELKHYLIANKISLRNE